MTQCAVQRCPNQATKPHTLRRDAMGIPTEVAVCQHHADELTDPYAEWMYDYSKDPVTNQFNASVLTGESLQGLDEYIVTAAPDTVRLYTPAARIYSHQDHNGVHVPIHVRRRGSEDYKEITLVIPHDKLSALVELLTRHVPQASGPGHPHPPTMDQ